MSDKINFTFTKIKTEQFAIIDSSFSKGKDIGFGIETRYGINEVDKMIFVFLETNFLQENAPFLKLEVSCFFNVAKENWSSFIKKSKFSIPADFARHLLMLTIGTTRGILHTKTENTPFNEFLIPTINLNEIITEDIDFELDKKF